MKKFLAALLLVFVAILSFQCQKEISHGGGDPDNDVLITRTVQGNIVDENGQPASGVTVRVGSKTVITDAKGYFRVVNAGISKNASLVTAEKSGYFKAYRSFIATSGANHVSMKLIKKELAGTIAAGGGEITLSNGAKVALPANAVVKAAGGSYSGAVNVYAAYIDPAAGDISETVPGSFMADDGNNKRVTLASYGMMAVELESASGEKLQIATDKTATLTMPIPLSIQSSAPATISLWYVDEQTGIWKEEGTAAKSGTQYIGQVKHFSFWNCDVSMQAINLSMTIKNNEGAPLVHVPVRLTRTAPGPGSQSYGFTDSLGQVSGLVPANEALLLEVLDPCHNAVYSQNIGPFAQHTNLGVITITNSGSALVTIKGTLLNCSGSPVTNGYAIIAIGNNSSYVNVNSSGEFSLSMTRCSATPATCDITGVDNGTQQQGTVSGITIVSPITNAGNIMACGTSSLQYINYTLNGTNYSITSIASDSLYMFTSQQGAVPYVTTAGAWNSATNASINFAFTSPMAPGVYPMDRLSVNGFQNQFLIQPFNIAVTNFPTVPGGFYEGSFSGQFRDPQVTTPVHTISGTFRMRRQ
jgi:hypothetical protein